MFGSTSKHGSIRMNINFINKIRNNIDTELEGGGYKITNAHFEIGNHLHSNQYYFAKRYFQNSLNCDDFEKMLYDKLTELKFPEQTTLISYHNYTGLLLNKVVKSFDNFNYAIIEKDGDTFIWQHLPTLKDNLVIILPTTCTCTTYFKLQKFVESQIADQPQKRVNDNFIILFTILDKSLENRENETIIIDDNEEYLKRIYAPFNWTEISKNQIKVGKNTANTLVRLYSKMYLPESCPLCFPENTRKERPLFPTLDNFETPNLILGFPNFSSEQTRLDFFKTFDSFDEDKQSHLYGHISTNGTSYGNYIRGNAFYANNKRKILDFFNEKLSFFFEQTKTQRENTCDENVLFITAETKHNSNFLEDISLESSLNSKSVTILRFEPSNEFVDNFISLHKSIIKNENCQVIYFEDVLSAGKTFKLISDYIKHAKNDNPFEIKTRGFDLVLTLVDRTPLYTKAEILKKISLGENDIPQERFISFFRLNVPIISASHLGNPLEEKTKNLDKMINQCHLDSLKMTIGREIHKRQPRKLPELDTLNRKEALLKCFPFGDIDRKINVNLFNVYKDRFRKESLNLLKLHLTHEINSELAKPVYQRGNGFVREKTEKFIENLINKINPENEDRFGNYFVSPEDFESAYRKKDIEREIVHDAIIKILSRPPFTYYKNIHESIFHYVTKKLNESLKTEQIISFADFRKFKFYTKRSVVLKSNFIISKRFIENIKKFYNKDYIEAIKESHKNSQRNLNALRDAGEIDEDYYQAAQSNVGYKLEQLALYYSHLLYYYKELIFTNPSLSIRLEKLLNDSDLLPENWNAQDTLVTRVNFSKYELKNLIADLYFQFWWMLKAENIYLLDGLKELHKRNLDDPKIDRFDYKRDFKKKKYQKYYFTPNKKNDPIIVNAQKLIDKREDQAADNKDVTQSISHMLQTIDVLEEKRKNRTVSAKPLNEEIKEILESAKKIIQSNLGEDEFKFAFFVKFKKRTQSEDDTENIYSLISNKWFDNNDDIKLDQHVNEVRLNENGLIYNLLRGLYDDRDSKNEQNLISGIKFSEGRFVSFNKHLYFLRNETLEKVRFSRLYKNDFYDPSTGRGLKKLDEANMSLYIRFANLLKQDNDKADNHCKLEGQAVLLITSNQKSNLNNFKNFISDEKVRLLLLIKEELLEYLQKQFDNDAFFDVLANKEKAKYVDSLEHDLRDYLLTLKQIYGKETSLSDETVEKLELFCDAIHFQISRNAPEVSREIVALTREDMIKTFRLIFESEIEKVIDFKKDVNIDGFNLTNLTTDKKAFTLVVLEIIMNMKKYSPQFSFQQRGFSISSYENKICFKNIIHPKLVKSSEELNLEERLSGLYMCKRIMVDNELVDLTYRKEKISEQILFVVEVAFNNKQVE